MLGSSLSVSGPNVILNTAVAEALDAFYNELKDTPAEEMEHAVHELLKRAIRKHRKIIFDGNGYTDEWVEEAQKRGLYNLKSTPDALPQFIAKKNLDLFRKHHIFSEKEVYSRYDILLENYSKTICIEGKTMAEMVIKDVMPSSMAYMHKLTQEASEKKSLIADLSVETETALLKKLTELYAKMSSKTAALKDAIAKADAESDALKQAQLFHDEVLSAMDELRVYADASEALIPDDFLSYPTYDKLLFSV